MIRVQSSPTKRYGAKETTRWTERQERTGEREVGMYTPLFVAPAGFDRSRLSSFSFKADRFGCKEPVVVEELDMITANGFALCICQMNE